MQCNLRRLLVLLPGKEKNENPHCDTIDAHFIVVPFTYVMRSTR